MIAVKEITDSADALLERLYALCLESFPKEEIRDMAQVRQLMEREKRFHLNSIEWEGEPAGMLVYWTFEDFDYIELLVIFPSMRTQHAGLHAVDWINGHLKPVRLFEVEPDTDRYTRLRIRMYERKGFHIVDKSYIQPRLRPEDRVNPLWIMCSVEGDPRLPDYIRTLRREVYFEK